MSDPDIERRLTEIRDEVRELHRLLVGNGHDSALGRLNSVEHEYDSMRVCYRWVMALIAALAWMVVPDYFTRQK